MRRASCFFLCCLLLGLSGCESLGVLPSLRDDGPASVPRVLQPAAALPLPVAPRAADEVSARVQASVTLFADVCLATGSDKTVAERAEELDLQLQGLAGDGLQTTSIYTRDGQFGEVELLARLDGRCTVVAWQVAGEQILARLYGQLTDAQREVILTEQRFDEDDYVQYRHRLIETAADGTRAESRTLIVTVTDAADAEFQAAITLVSAAGSTPPSG